MRKIIIAFVLILFFASACAPREDEDTIMAKKIIQYHKNQFNNLPLSGKIINGIREINVQAQQYSWSPDPVVVKKGEQIRLMVENLDVPHGFELEGIQIPGWDTNTPIKKGEKIILNYTADESGTWDVVCTVYCGPGHGGMRGKYIVKD